MWYEVYIYDIGKIVHYQPWKNSLFVIYSWVLFVLFIIRLSINVVLAHKLEHIAISKPSKYRRNKKKLKKLKLKLKKNKKNN